MWDRGAGVADRFWISAAAKGLEFYCLESPTPGTFFETYGCQFTLILAY